MSQLQETDNIALDIAAISAWIAAFAGWLPSVAAALSIVGTLIRIWETKTVQRFVARVRKSDG